MKESLVLLCCVMSVRNQTSHAFVAASGTFFDSSCKFVYRPKNVKSTNSVQILLTIVQPFPVLPFCSAFLSVGPQDIATHFFA